MYSLASCEYQIMNGLTAASAAATMPARADTSSRPHRKVIGTTAVPASADNERSPTSDVPKTFAQTQPRRKYKGGFVSCAVIELSMEPNDRCSSWAAWASSNQ